MSKFNIERDLKTNEDALRLIEALMDNPSNLAEKTAKSVNILSDFLKEAANDKALNESLIEMIENYKPMIIFAAKLYINTYKAALEYIEANFTDEVENTLAGHYINVEKAAKGVQLSFLSKIKAYMLKSKLTAIWKDLGEKLSAIIEG